MEDKIKSDSFFDIDNNIYKNLRNLNRKPIYLLHYPKGKEMNFSQGTIKYIHEDDDYNIDHVCDSDPGSSGGPLVNSVDYKVIGIHKRGVLGSKNFNLSTIIKEPIEEYKKKFSKEDIEKMNKLEPKKVEPIKKIIK